MTAEFVPRCLGARAHGYADHSPRRAMVTAFSDYSFPGRFQVLDLVCEHPNLSQVEDCLAGRARFVHKGILMAVLGSVKCSKPSKWRNSLLLLLFKAS